MRRMPNGLPYEKTFYLSGAMSGLPNYNFDQFNKVEQMLREEFPHWDFINPAKESVMYAENTGRKLSEIRKHEFLVMDFKHIKNSATDGIIMMYGWQRSQGGAHAELALTILEGKEVLYLDDEKFGIKLTSQEIEYQDFSNIW